MLSKLMDPEVLGIAAAAIYLYVHLYRRVDALTARVEYLELQLSTRVAPAVDAFYGHLNEHRGE